MKEKDWRIQIREPETWAKVLNAARWALGIDEDENTEKKLPKFKVINGGLAGRYRNGSRSRL